MVKSENGNFILESGGGKSSEVFRKLLSPLNPNRNSWDHGCTLMRVIPKQS